MSMHVTGPGPDGWLGMAPDGYRDFGDPWPPPRQRRSLMEWLRDTYNGLRNR